MKTELIKLTEEGPFRHRDRYMSIGKGQVAEVPVEHAERMLDRYDFFVQLCGTVKDDGNRCRNTKGSCQYHDDKPDKSDT